MLPRIELPVFQTTLLSRKGPVNYTPFTVKESTILMMAKESGEVKSMVEALKQIISNCLLDKSIDVDKLPMIDLEWLFLQIHSKSSGEVLPLVFKCNHEQCGMLLECSVDLTKVKIQNSNTNKRIMLTDKIGVEMKFPTFEATQQALLVEQTLEDHMLAAMCIDIVFDENSVTKMADASHEEILAFVQSIPDDKYQLIKKFVQDSPKIKHTINQKCGKCGFDHKIELEGLEDFFE